MHIEVETFLKSDPVASLPWRHAHVVEVGAQNVNGAARDLVPEGWAAWVGVDLVAGVGVDYVGDAAEILPRFAEWSRPFDFAVSTEVFEHAENWRGILHGFTLCVRRGGFLVATCAGTGRAPHGANGAAMPEPGEWYRNVSGADLSIALDVLGWRILHLEEGPPGDTRVVAQRS